jgi:hypothetical protein
MLTWFDIVGVALSVQERQLFRRLERYELSLDMSAQVPYFRKRAPDSDKDARVFEERVSRVLDCTAAYVQRHEFWPPTCNLNSSKPGFFEELCQQGPVEKQQMSWWLQPTPMTPKEPMAMARNIWCFNPEIAIRFEQALAIPKQTSRIMNMLYDVTQRDSVVF